MSHRKATSDSHETQSFHHARSNFYRSREAICENRDRDFLTELKFPRSTIRKFNSHSVRSFHIYAESIESMLVLTESGVRRNCPALSGRCCCNGPGPECHGTQQGYGPPLDGFPYEHRAVKLVEVTYPVPRQSGGAGLSEGPSPASLSLDLEGLTSASEQLAPLPASRHLPKSGELTVGQEAVI